jgi:hypothetical protein
MNVSTYNCFFLFHPNKKSIYQSAHYIHITIQARVNRNTGTINVNIIDPLLCTLKERYISFEEILDD